jgi:hypothetical protein
MKYFLKELVFLKGGLNELLPKMGVERISVFGGTEHFSQRV